MAYLYMLQKWEVNLFGVQLLFHSLFQVETTLEAMGTQLGSNFSRFMKPLCLEHNVTCSLYFYTKINSFMNQEASRNNCAELIMQLVFTLKVKLAPI